MGRLWNKASRDARSVLLCSLVGFSPAGFLAQNEPFIPPLHASLGEAPARSVRLEGFVLGPDGTPAEDAVVVSSAGGKAVTDVFGTYRLALEVPRGALRVRVTAVGKGGVGRMDSADVVLAGSGTTRVEPLTLARGASCSPRWLPTFGGQPGTDGVIHALAVYDDGTGPALYVGGSFWSAGGVQAAHVARWDGTSWSALGGGMDASVFALAVHDDGTGPALYAGGGFRTADGLAASRIARWDGASWSPVGGGVDGFAPGTSPSVRALVVHNDGGGPALYAAGEFTSAGGAPANRVAKWDGSSWSKLGSGLTNDFMAFPTALALATHDDGTGPALFVGGGFLRAGGTNVQGVARWNGSGWSALGGGMDAPVRALATFDDGGGTELYAGGEFTAAGGLAASRVARWNGTSWSSVGSGTDEAVHALRVFDEGSGPALFAGGEFTSAGGTPANGAARWDGSGWSALGSEASGPAGFPPVLAFMEHDEGGGPTLFAAGYLRSAGGLGAGHIARWDGSSWSLLGSGLGRFVSALTVFDDGGGAALYAGGGFPSAGGVVANGIARWDGTNWSPLGSGIENSIPADQAAGVRALVVHDDGSGPALYAGGRFQILGGVAANGIARWDGTSWSSLGGGVTGATFGQSGVFALASHDDGSGPALYAGGGFTSAGGLPANRIARWDGSAWHPLGAGTFSLVYTLAGYDDGSGPALYAGGNFVEAGGLTVNSIARWDGSSWSALGTGLDNFFSRPTALDLLVHDDGSGPALFVGGTFASAGGVTAYGLAKWQGGSWSRVGHVQGASVFALGAFDDGQGLALHASGTFLGLQGVGKWDGSGWTTLGSPTPNAFLSDHVSRALVAFDDGSGPALLSAGSAFDSGDSYLSRWSHPEDLDPPLLSCPSAVGVLDVLGSPSGETVDFTVTASDCRDPAPSVVCVPPSGSFFPRGTTIVTCTALDSAGNQASCQFPVTVSPKARRR